MKKAESRRVDAFELRCWRRLLRVPWTYRRSNQSVLKEISPRCLLEGLMLKVKLQYFGHLMWTDSPEKTLTLGKTEGRRRRGWQRVRWSNSITDSMDMSLNKLPGVGDGQGGLACCSPWGHKESDTTERLNWAEILVNSQALCFTDCQPLSLSEYTVHANTSFLCPMPVWLTYAMTKNKGMHAFCSCVHST